VFVIGEGARVIPFCGVFHRPADQRVRVAGAQPERAVVVRDRALRFPFARPRQGAVVIGAAEFGIELDREVEVGQRAVVIALVRPFGAARVIGLRKIGTLEFAELDQTGARLNRQGRVTRSRAALRLLGRRLRCRVCSGRHEQRRRPQQMPYGVRQHGAMPVSAARPGSAAMPTIA
jgi:hypothetical protein